MKDYSIYELRKITEAYNRVVNESLFDELKTCTENIIDEFIDDKNRGIDKKRWNLIPASQYEYALSKFIEEGPELYSFPDRILNSWIDLIIENTQEIDIIGELTGRNELNGLPPIRPEIIKEFFPIEFEKNVEELKKHNYIPDRIEITAASNTLYDVGFYDWAVLPDGGDADSDNGVQGVEEILDELDYDSTPSDKIVAINRCLDVFHRRSDWSSAFIEGGKETLSRISNLRRNID